MIIVIAALSPYHTRLQVIVIIVRKYLRCAHKRLFIIIIVVLFTSLSCIFTTLTDQGDRVHMTEAVLRRQLIEIVYIVEVARLRTEVMIEVFFC